MSHSSNRRGQRISNPPIRVRVLYETSGYAAKRSCSGFLTRQMQVRVLLLPLIKASSNGGAAVSDADIVQGQVRVISNETGWLRTTCCAFDSCRGYCGCGRIGHAAACDAAICGFESRQSPHEIKDLPEPGEESGFRRSFCNASVTKTSLIRILNQQIKTQPQL